MKTKHIITYLTALPWNITVGWPIILTIWLLWGTDLRWEKPPMGHHGWYVLACNFKPGSWPDRTWYRMWGGTTLGHAILYRPNRVEWDHLHFHEHIHVKQFEGVSFSSFVTAAWVGSVILLSGDSSVAFWVFMGIWWSGYLMMGIGGWAAAFFRGEDPYRGSAHEESAYAQEEIYIRTSRERGEI